MRFKKQLLVIGSLATAIVCLAAPAMAAVDPVEKDGKGVAVKGYDVVAYFTQSKPVKGTPQFTHQWNGATWQFASAADRDLFAADPAKYARNTAATALMVSARTMQFPLTRRRGALSKASSTSITAKACKRRGWRTLPSA